RGGTLPSRATPIALAQRVDLPWLLAALRGGAAPEAPESEAVRAVLAALEQSGALFRDELAARAGVPGTAVEPALWELVSGGWITSDGIPALRQRLDRGALVSGRRAERDRRRPGRAAQGRWAILSAPPPGD